MIWMIPLLIFVVVVCSMIRIVPQAEIYVIERLGKYHASWDAGIHFLVPVIDNVVKKVSLKEQVLDFPPQGVITRDNVTMSIDSIVFMHVFDAKAFTYGVENPIQGIENLAATTLRNLVGQLELDAVLSSRDLINANMQKELAEAVQPWGMQVIRVEVKNVNPPQEIAEVMTKQMRAEREKRQAILEAEAHKQSIITRAEGDKQAKVLAAEAERDAQIALAEGKAKSIKMVYDAEAEGLERMSKVRYSNGVLTLKGYEALAKVADGNATKMIVPSNVADVFSALNIAGIAVKEGEDAEKRKTYSIRKSNEDLNVDDPCEDRHESYISQEIIEDSNEKGEDL